MYLHTNGILKQSRRMLKINFKQFIYDRVWFGYGRAARFKIPKGWTWGWVKL